MNTKRIIGIILGIALLGIIFALLKADIGMDNPWLDGKKENAEVGDLVIPVTATGVIEPARTIQIKSKAGGQVLKIHVVEGQIVKKGELLVELDPVDEKRNVEARQADLDRSNSAVEKARITIENYRLDLPLQTRLAKARLDDATARFMDAEFRWEKVKSYDKELTNPQEQVTTKASYLAATAAKDQATADHERAKNNEQILLRGAQEDEKQAAAMQKIAQKQLDEAKLRLEETTVRARSNGMVYNILIHEGEMIQSGVASFTGGSILMILADTSAMFVVAQVDETDIGAVRNIAPEYARPGQTQMLTEEEYGAKAQEILQQMQVGLVDVKIDAYKRDNYQGVVERILPEPIKVSGAIAFKVRIRLMGEELEKLMGLQADLSFMTQKEKGLILIKNEALHSEGRNCFVYIPVPGKPREEEKVAVEIGITDGTSTEIKKGLKAGDEVFVKRPVKTEKEKEQNQKG